MISYSFKATCPLAPRFELSTRISLTGECQFLSSDPRRPSTHYELNVDLVLQGGMDLDTHTDMTGPLLIPDGCLSMRGLAALLNPSVEQPAVAPLVCCEDYDDGESHVESHAVHYEQWPFIRWNNFRFQYRNRDGQVLETPQTVYFLRKHVGDIVEITMRELRKLAEALPGQLTGVYDDDFRSFYSEYFGVDAPPAYKCP